MRQDTDPTSCDETPPTSAAQGHGAITTDTIPAEVRSGNGEGQTMGRTPNETGPLEQARLPVRAKLAAAWATWPGTVQATVNHRVSEVSV